MITIEIFEIFKKNFLFEMKEIKFFKFKTKCIVGEVGSEMQYSIKK